MQPLYPNRKKLSHVDVIRNQYSFRRPTLELVHGVIVSICPFPLPLSSVSTGSSLRPRTSAQAVYFYINNELRVGGVHLIASL